MLRKINDRGRQLIKDFEGLRLVPYRDSVGVWTVGYGHTSGVNSRSPVITAAQADLLLQGDLGWAERAVLRLIKAPLSNNEFAALVSFTFNLGAGRLQMSTLRCKLNRGDYMGAADEFWKWRRAGGVILRGLVRRRAAETSLFLS